MDVPRQELAGPLPWYKSIRGAADTTEEIPGYLCGAGTGTETFIVECVGSYEFKTSVAPANTPEFLQLRKKLRDLRIAEEQNRRKAAILSSLSPPALGPTLLKQSSV